MTDIPTTVAPQPIDPAIPVRPKLYSIAAMDVATFLGSWFAGALLISRNYSRLGNPDAARNALFLGFIALIGLAFVAFSIVVPEKYERLLSVSIQAAQVAAVHILAKRFQGSALAEHEELGGHFYSRWRAAGVALLAAPVALAVIFSVGLFFPGLPGLAE